MIRPQKRGRISFAGTVKAMEEADMKKTSFYKMVKKCEGMVNI
jgi:hypothetical protein